MMADMKRRVVIGLEAEIADGKMGTGREMIDAKLEEMTGEAIERKIKGIFGEMTGGSSQQAFVTNWSVICF